LESFEQGHAERISGSDVEAGAIGCYFESGVQSTDASRAYRSEKERNGNAVKNLQFLYRPKNPGSIKYQLTKPANNPIPVTTSTIIFSLAVVGLPAIEGNIKRNKPPTPTTGLNAASFIE